MINAIVVEACSDVIIRRNTVTNDLEIHMHRDAILGVETSTVRVIHENMPVQTRSFNPMDLVRITPLTGAFLLIFICVTILTGELQQLFIGLSGLVILNLVRMRREDEVDRQKDYVTRQIDTPYVIRSISVRGKGSTALFLDKLEPIMAIQVHDGGSFYLGRANERSPDETRLASLDVLLTGSGNVHMGELSTSHASLVSHGTGKISNVKIEEHALLDVQHGGRITYSRSNHCVVIRKNTGLGILSETRHSTTKVITSECSCDVLTRTKACVVCVSPHRLTEWERKMDCRQCTPKKPVMFCGKCDFICDLCTEEGWISLAGTGGGDAIYNDKLNMEIVNGQLQSRG